MRCEGRASRSGKVSPALSAVSALRFKVGLFCFIFFCFLWWMGHIKHGHRFIKPFQCLAPTSQAWRSDLPRSARRRQPRWHPPAGVSPPPEPSVSAGLQSYPESSSGSWWTPTPSGRWEGKFRNCLADDDIRRQAVSSEVDQLYTSQLFTLVFFRLQSWWTCSKPVLKAAIQHFNH